MRNIVRKITSVATAAALALTLNPASALAHEQTNATIPLAASTATGQSAGSADAGASGAALPYASARANSLSVDAPLRVTFEGAGNAAYDVNNKASWGTLNANVTFTNWYDSAVYLAGAEVKQTSDVNVGNVFSGSTVGSASHPFLTLTTADGSNSATLATLASSTSGTDAMQFGASANQDDQLKVMKRFKVKKNADGNGTSSTFNLALDATDAALQDTATLDAAASLKGNVTDFASIVWTFAVSQGVSADGDTGDDFYLKVNDNASNANLVDHKGEVYSLENVSEMADDISENGSASDYYAMFDAMLATDAAGSSQYECKATWKDSTSSTGYTAYSVRIIGINHDELADGTGKAGLTFQFVNLLNTKFRMNMTGGNTGGWGSTLIRTQMNEKTNDTDIWSLIPTDQQNAFQTVKKYYSSTNSGAGTAASSDDKVFLASYYELGGSNENWSTNTYLATLEGTQYAYWKKRGATGKNASQTVLKMISQDNKTTNWMLQRSMYPNNTSYFLTVDPNGNPTSYTTYSGLSGICPCFCLGRAPVSNSGNGNMDPGSLTDKTDEELASEGFYLKINSDASNPELAKVRGEVYSLSDVAKMAEDISSNATTSAYYAMFNEMVGSANNQYTCKVKWDSTYDVRVIGINHDNLADGSGKAGLTFQFVNLLNKAYIMKTNDGTSANWGGSELITTLNSGSVWNTIPADQQAAFKTVRKPYSTSHSGSGSGHSSNDKVFCASYFELGGSLDTTLATATYLALVEGTQYAYWSYVGATGSKSNQSVLVKGMQKSPTSGYYWWTRSKSTDSNAFFAVSAAGAPGTSSGIEGAMGICPCFCL